MNFVRITNLDLPQFPLFRDVTRHLKRGHRWVFANSFSSQDGVSSGLALLTYKNESLAVGVVQSDTQLRFRLFFLIEDVLFRKNNLQRTIDDWFVAQWTKAVSLRLTIDFEFTNSFRLINGEGDGLPGLVIDIYNEVAVIKHDHPIMEEVWNHEALADLLVRDFPHLRTVYLKRKNDHERKGECILGELPKEVIFKENGVQFASNIRDAAKTGFFLDQRDNRKLIQSFSKGRRVLNLFSYTGGFSLFSALGGATHVTSVDIAQAAIENVTRNFELNRITIPHEDLAQDAFAFVAEQIRLKSRYDLVITDPPSFAPNEKSVPQATAAYIKIFSDSLRLVAPKGLFAASSCSSHISSEAFLEITREAFSKARQKGTLVYFGGQPIDHPYPLAMQELRYLKFVLMRLD